MTDFSEHKKKIVFRNIPKYLGPFGEMDWEPRDKILLGLCQEIAVEPQISAFISLHVNILVGVTSAMLAKKFPPCYSSSLLLKSGLAQILAKYFEILKPQVVNLYTIAKERPHFREGELRCLKQLGLHVAGVCL